MQMIKHYAGLLLIVLGALALIMTRLKALDSSNTLEASSEKAGTEILYFEKWNKSRYLHN